MKKASFRKLSILGLVLVAASAVTAAVIPANSKPQAGDGQLVDTTDGKSCTNAGLGAACNDTANSATTGTGASSAAHTDQNTTTR